ncbi:two-component sensor histidine kinase, partial [Herbaspirillum frisingense]
MKDFLGSIGNRIFFLLLAGIVVAVMATTWLSGNERRSTLRELRFQHLADRVEQIVQAVDDIPPPQRPIVLQAATNFGFEARMVDDMNDAIGPNASTSPLIEMLQSRLGEDRKIAVQRESECPPLRADDAHAPRRDTCRVIYVSLHDQALMRLRLHQPGEPPTLRGRGGPGGPFGLQYIMLFLALIAMLAWLVARMAT